MLSKNKKYDWLSIVKINSTDHMQITAERLLNPYNYHLSAEAKKRLRWLYILYHDQRSNVTKAANKIGISRPWLSKIKSVFENSRRDPRSLEPESKAPRNVSNRKRVPKDTENKIIEIRDEYGWGKDKISAFLRTEYNMRVNPNTTNKYLHKHKKISPKISLKNSRAWESKKQRERGVALELNSDLRRESKITLPGL